MKVTARAGERGVAIYVTTVILVMAIPMVGLAIDGTLLYIDKCRLQGAVDGAALAAAKALARGSDDATQISNAKAAAATYVMLNYPASYFFTSSLTVDQTTDVTVDETVTHQRIISVTAHATVPTLFMRYLNFTSTNVNAVATTVRRDVNIALVVDRSGSLASSNSCAPLQQSAVNFVNKFSNGRDEISLVTFASSTNVDFPMATNFLSATPNVPTLINSFVCAASTSSAMGLWYGYDQLVGLNQPAALNVILFFTDGKPTAVNVNMPLNNSSPCDQYHAGPPGPSRWINGNINTYTNQDKFFGLLKPVNGGTIPSGDFAATTDANTGHNCNYMSGGWSGNDEDMSDFAGVPLRDVFGDNLDNGYKTITKNAAGYIDVGNATNSDNLAMNAADDAARQIRTGTALCANAQAPTSSCTNLLTHSGSLSNVIIYSIGLGNATYPLSPDLLERVSNDKRSTVPYDPNMPTGLYLPAPTSADIDAAFAQVASEILRLSR